jgi:hypothetical protein
MADIISDFLERTKSAKGDPQIQAALAAEFAVAARAEPEQSALREALDVVALLHWFDAGLLEQMLELSAEDALERLEALKSLPFVERYRRSESELQNELFNVHEATRLGWRRQMAHENPNRFRRLSSRAAECFADDRTPTGRIEYVYHLLCDDPEWGAGELVELDRKWEAAGAHPVDFYALAAVLRELIDTALVDGRPRAATLLAYVEGRARAEHLGALLTSIRMAVRIRWEIVRPFVLESNLRILAAFNARKLRFDLQRCFNTIFIEAEFRGNFSPIDVWRAFETSADQSKFQTMIEEWDHTYAKFGEVLVSMT